MPYNVADGGLYLPQGVSASDGTVYVSNTADNVVAAIKGGTTTVIAGTLGGNGDHGDGGPATSATLYQPTGTAEDSAGDVFIADSGDNVIREITPDGIIHRFAGTGVPGSRLDPGSATGTQLDNPEGVAVAPDGDVIIADTDNNRVLSVARSGKVTVVAGTGTAGYAGDGGRAAAAALDQPSGVAVDSQGDVYIADSANNVVRKVNAKKETITTVAGDYAKDKGATNGLGDYTGDGGPATLAQLNDPQGIAIDSSGNLYIADTYNNAIREVAPDGTITSVVSPSVGQLDEPSAVAVDASSGRLYISDTNDSTIYSVDSGTITSLYDFSTGTEGWQPGQNVSSVSSVTSFAEGPGAPIGSTHALQAVEESVPPSEFRSVTVSPSPGLDVSGASAFFASIDCYGGTPGGGGYIATITLTSGTHTLAQSFSMNANEWNSLIMNIASWPYANDITGIEIGFRGTSTSTTGWAGQFHLDQIGYLN